MPIRFEAEGPAKRTEWKGHAFRGLLLGKARPGGQISVVVFSMAKTFSSLLHNSSRFWRV